MDYRSSIVEAILKVTELDKDTVSKLLEIPPKQDMGDYAFPTFVLAKSFRKAPPIIAEEIASSLMDKISDVDIKAVGPYVNFFIDRGAFASSIVSRINSLKDGYGSSNIGEGKRVIVEYSSPNIAKPFHVGHAFTTIIGNSLSRIYSKLGYNVIRMNHLGDYGTQFGKLITAYRLWGDEEKLIEDPINELLRIYVKFHEEEKKDPSLSVSARENFRKLENGEEEELKLWQRFRDLSLVVFNKLYDRMGVSFDNYNGESFYSDKIPQVVDMLKEKDLLVESEGAQVVMLEDKKLPPCIILKSDGTTIYASRDLASAIYRHDEYNFDKNIYVVGMPQAMHFAQVFAVLEKAGYEWAKDCEHVGFGLVKFENMKFSTRDGNIILLEDLLNETVSKIKDVIIENNNSRGNEMSAEEIDEISEKIGLGAVIYTYLKSGRERDIIFKWEDMLDFNGDTAPYLIYTYARTRSILRKAESMGIDASEANLSILTSDDEYSLIRSLQDFESAICKAASSNEPFMISRSLFGIARDFNRFYNNSSILNSDNDDIRNARLMLCKALTYTLKSGLNLLGIEEVEKM